MILQSNLLLTELSIKYIESRMQNLPFFSSTFHFKMYEYCKGKLLYSHFWSENVKSKI